MVNALLRSECEELLFALDNALAAHLNWRREFIRSIADDKVTQNVAEARLDDYCAVGKWLSGLTFGQRSPRHYETVLSLHHRFHLEAGCLLAMGSRSATVGEQWSRMDQISDELIAAFEAWRSDVADARPPG